MREFLILWPEMCTGFDTNTWAIYGLLHSHSNQQSGIYMRSYQSIQSSKRHDGQPYITLAHTVCWSYTTSILYMQILTIGVYVYIDKCRITWMLLHLVKMQSSHPHRNVDYSIESPICIWISLQFTPASQDDMGTGLRNWDFRLALELLSHVADSCDTNIGASWYLR